MKKTLALLFTVIMAFTCFSTFASAEVGSPVNDKGIIEEATVKDKDNNTLTTKFEKLPSTVDTTKFDTNLADLNKNSAKTFKIVEKRTISITGTAPAYPVTASFKVPGVTTSSKGYFLVLKDDNTVERVEATMGDGIMTGIFNSLKYVAFVVDEDTAAAVSVATGTSTSTESPKTSSDVVTPIAIALICLSAAVAGFSVKKIKATNR